MNWKSLVQFRKQVEDMIKEELALAEWRKSQELTKQQILQEDLGTISLELERNLPHGVGGAFTEERYRWLEETGHRLERQAQVIQECDQHIDALKGKLQHAYYERRVIEMLMTKQERERQQKILKAEQREQDQWAGTKVAQRRKGHH